MTKAISGLHYKSKNPISIYFEDGIVSDIRKSDHLEDSTFIAPGFVDLQINGFNGIDFNSESLKAHDVLKVTKDLWKHGTTTFFPTLITNSDQKTSTIIKSIVEACKEYAMVNDAVGGIHLEGPFLSPENGPRGAHPLQFIKAPDWNLFSKWQEEAEGRIKIITIAPEWEGSVEFIEKCSKSGVIVSLGHTAGNSEDIKKAVVAGATMSTHLGNACHLMLPRHSNYIWEQLAADGLWSSLIADGFHLPEAVLKVFLKVKPEKSILISDATKFAGLSPGTYSSHIGGEVLLNEKGRLSIKESPSMLAGSAQSLLWAIEHIAKSNIESLEKAIDMASLKPMEVAGSLLPYGIEKGSSGDFILYQRKADKIVISKTLKSGAIVYST